MVELILYFRNELLFVLANRVILVAGCAYEAVHQMIL